MRLYADLPARRTAQILADVAMLCWVGLWAWVGRYVHDSTMALAAPGRELQQAGGGFSDRMGGAAGSVGDLPILGDRLSGPLKDVGSIGDSIEGAGTTMIGAVTRLALVLGWVTALVPIVVVGAYWLYRRGRFVRRAGSAQRFIDSAADLDLFALRAMATQPMRSLEEISHDPVGAWRRGDRQVIRQLAELELKDCGLRAPAATTPSPRRR